jgi:hypothetical protein
MNISVCSRYFKSVQFYYEIDNPILQKLDEFKKQLDSFEMNLFTTFQDLNAQPKDSEEKMYDYSSTSTDNPRTVIRLSHFSFSCITGKMHSLKKKVEKSWSTFLSSTIQLSLSKNEYKCFNFNMTMTQKCYELLYRRKNLMCG